MTTLVAPTDLPREYCETASKRCNRLDKGDIDRCRRFDCALRWHVATGQSLKCDDCADALIERED